MNTWLTGANTKITGETLREAVSSNLHEIYRTCKSDQDHLLEIQDFKMEWKDGIFGSKGGVEVKIYAKISTCYTKDSPKYRESIREFTAWIHADKEDVINCCDKTVKQLREAAEMTRKEFSEYFNISARTVENWEYGRTTPPDYLVNLMEYKLRNENLLK